ncbi:MAG: hypothetical protein V1870_03045 [Candidatus Aenigmatarchaeota archaeon]
MVPITTVFSYDKEISLVKDVLGIFLDTLPEQYKEELHTTVKEVVLGQCPMDDYGCFNIEDSKIYLSDWLLSEQNPKKIVEYLFHEVGHALLNPYFPNNEHQQSAELLVYHALGQPYYTYLSPAIRKLYGRYYKEHKDFLVDEFGDNRQLVVDINEKITQTIPEWNRKNIDLIKKNVLE